MNKHLSADKLVIVTVGPKVPQKPLPAPTDKPPSSRSGYRSTNAKIHLLPARKPGKAGQGHLRIIAGEWRSRRLAVPEGEGLRPTPDRVRETIFNWLAPYIEGARVLDAFTGSGALVLEALPGAEDAVVALDSNPAAIANLKNNLKSSAARGANPANRCPALLAQNPASSSSTWCSSTRHSTRGLLANTCNLLEQHEWLSEQAWVYTESEAAPSPATARQLAFASREKPASITRCGRRGNL